MKPAFKSVCTLIKKDHGFKSCLEVNLCVYFFTTNYLHCYTPVWGSTMGQYSPTHFRRFSYVLQNAKQRESYTGHGTHLKDVAFGLYALHTWLKQWLNITVLQPVIHAGSQYLTIVICS